MIRITQTQFHQMTKRRRTTTRKPAPLAPVSATFDFPRWTLTLPLAVVSEANQREFWRKRHARNREQQARIFLEWLAAFGQAKPGTPATITLTRLGGNRLDSDNLAGAFKHVRDALADICEVNDGSDLLTWRYAQEPGGARGIRIEIEEGA